MIQHKHFKTYNGEWEEFDALKISGKVIREYETFSKKITGGIYIGCENKRKFFSIATHHGMRYDGYYNHEERKFVHSRHSKIMYEISEEIFEELYIKMVEKAL
jgi:hypothetical protein